MWEARNLRATAPSEGTNMDHMGRALGGGQVFWAETPVTSCPTGLASQSFWFTPFICKTEIIILTNL